MKKAVMLLFVFTLIMTLFVATFVPSYAADDKVTPGAIVDFGTIWGYAGFLENVHRDTEQLFTGEYTVHGMDGKVNYTFNSEGYSSFTPKEPLDENGKDADGKRQSGDWRMTCEIEFDPAEYGYIAFYYRLTDGAHMPVNQIYIRDDQHSGEFEGTTGLWTPPELVTNGEWQLKILDIAKVFPAASGTVKSLRIPIASRIGEVFDIQYVAAFKTQEDAENFDYAAYKASVEASHDAAEWEINEDGTIKWIEKEEAAPSPSDGAPAADNTNAPSGTDNDNNNTWIYIVAVVIIVAVLVLLCVVLLRKKKSGK